MIKGKKSNVGEVVKKQKKTSEETLKPVQKTKSLISKQKKKKLDYNSDEVNNKVKELKIREIKINKKSTTERKQEKSEDTSSDHEIPIEKLSAKVNKAEFEGVCADGVEYNMSNLIPHSEYCISSALDSSEENDELQTGSFVFSKEFPASIVENYNIKKSFASYLLIKISNWFLTFPEIKRNYNLIKDPLTFKIKKLTKEQKILDCATNNINDNSLSEEKELKDYINNFQKANGEELTILEDLLTKRKNLYKDLKFKAFFPFVPLKLSLTFIESYNIHFMVKKNEQQIQSELLEIRNTLINEAKADDTFYSFFKIDTLIDIEEVKKEIINDIKHIEKTKNPTKRLEKWAAKNENAQGYYIDIPTKCNKENKNKIIVLIEKMRDNFKEQQKKGNIYLQSKEFKTDIRLLSTSDLNKLPIANLNPLLKICSRWAKILLENNTIFISIPKNGGKTVKILKEKAKMELENILLEIDKTNTYSKKVENISKKIKKFNTNKVERLLEKIEYIIGKYPKDDEKILEYIRLVDKTKFNKYKSQPEESIIEGTRNDLIKLSKDSSNLSLLYTNLKNTKLYITDSDYLKEVAKQEFLVKVLAYRKINRDKAKSILIEIETKERAVVPPGLNSTVDILHHGSMSHLLGELGSYKHIGSYHNETLKNFSSYFQSKHVSKTDINQIQEREEELESLFLIEIMRNSAALLTNPMFFELAQAEYVPLRIVAEYKVEQAKKAYDVVQKK